VRPIALVVPFAAGVLALSGCGADDGTVDTPPAADAADTAPAEPTSEGDALTATLMDPDGAEVGSVELVPADGGTQVSVTVTDLPPGFHGFHVHAVGACEPDSANPSDPTKTGDFLSAGGHLKGADDATHGEHAGDLPSLLVGPDGAASLAFLAPGLSTDDLLDEDGSAVMVHAERDNFANVPERYAATGPDQDTLNTGDAGGRIACGVVEQG
jgi:superoxide dismutase, Cu-Zn family